MCITAIQPSYDKMVPVANLAHCNFLQFQKYAGT
jgi:hypothetical protein